MTRKRARDSGWRAYHISTLGLFLVLWVTPALGQGLEPELEEFQKEQPGESGPVLIEPRLPTTRTPGQPAAGRTMPEAPVEAPKEAPAVESRPESDEYVSSLKRHILDVLTTDAGTNATTFLRRFELSNQYRDSQGPARSDNTTVRVDWPIFRGIGLLRVDVPVRWFDQNMAGTTTSSGLGDLLFRNGYRLINTPKFKLFAGADIFFPTATESDLGLGKYQLGPGVVASIPVEAVNSVFFPLIEHVQSIGGDPGRANVNHTRFNLDMTTPWTPEWWTAIESKLTVDWTKSGKTGMNLEFEVGRKLGPHYRTWVRGGAGLWGDGVFGSYDWIAEMGIRYMY